MHPLETTRGWVLETDAEQRGFNAERVKRGGRAYERQSLAVGDEAWLYRSTQGPHFTQVFWRAGRTVATIMTWGMSRDQTLKLARVMQRRIRTLG